MPLSRVCFQIVAVAALFTLALRSQAHAGEAGNAPVSGSLPKITDLPAGIASFGAAIDGDWLYVYGGHMGQTHSYSTQQVSKNFQRANLREGGQWQELPRGPALQGLVLVEYDGLLYRVGGMSARNEPGAPEDLHSLADVARFDPQTSAWTPLPSLPEGRSSHAAVVLDGRLYVVGGWHMRGAQEPRWHTTSLVLDLRAKQPAWIALPKQPFERRALAAATADGKLYAIGGLQAAGGISNQTDVFDLASHTWSIGPAIPGMPMNGNGIAACTAGGRIYISGLDGKIYGLASDHASWDVAARLETPRFHHRLLPMRTGALLAVAGATRSGKLRSVDTIVLPTAESAR